MLPVEGWSRGCARAISSSLSTSLSPLPFMIRFYLSSNPKVWFTMVPYAVCGLVVVVCPAFFVPLQPRPCVFFFLFSFYHEETGRPSRNEKRTRAEMKNRRGGAPLVVKSFFWLTVTRAGRCLSFNEFASSDLSASPRSVTDLSD